MGNLWKILGMFSGLGGIQKCFFADDDDGKGGGGGDDDDKGDDDKGDDDKGGKGDDDDSKKAPETRSVKVAGVEKLVTFDEALEGYTKAAGADALMREAAEIRKSSKSGAEIKEAFEKVMKADDVDVSDIRNLANVMGVDPAEMEAMFTEELEKLGGKGGKASAGVKKVTKDQLDDETKEILDQAKADQIAKAEEKIMEMCKESVDKDEFFGKMIKETPEELRDARKDVIVRMVHRDVRGKILASPYTEEKFGTEMIQNSIQTIRSELKNYGIPSKSSKQSAITNLLASLGPTGGLPAEVQSDETIERVPSTEKGYEDNVVKRLGQKMVQSLVKKHG